MSAAVALDPVALLEDLLQVPSVTGSTAAAAAALVEQAGAAGFDSHMDEAGSVVMRWGHGAATTDVVLLGHLDTVSGDIPVRQHEGRLHGRGAVDAKGPLAAAIAAVAALPLHGAPITIIAVCDEEGPSLGARHLRRRPAPSALIVLEPSGWDTITTGYRGCVRLTASMARGRAHHAAPDPGAADLLVTALAELQERLHSRCGAVAGDGRRAVDAVQVRINALSAVEHDESQVAQAAIEVRLPVGTSIDGVLRTVAHTLGDAQIEVESASPAVSVARSNPVARRLARAITVAGGRPRYTTKTGTCDLNVVAPAWGCAAAVYGPGDCSLDHTPRESIDIAELRRGSVVLRDAVAALR